MLIEILIYCLIFASVVYMLYRNNRVYKYLTKASEEIRKEYDKKMFDRRMSPKDKESSNDLEDHIEILRELREFSRRLNDLPDYGYMMAKFWVWPLNKFKKEDTL